MSDFCRQMQGRFTLCGGDQKISSILLEKLKQGSLAIHRGKMNRGDASLSPWRVNIRPALEKQFHDLLLSR